VLGFWVGSSRKKVNFILALDEPFSGDRYLEGLFPGKFRIEVVVPTLLVARPLFKGT